VTVREGGVDVVVIVLVTGLVVIVSVPEVHVEVTRGNLAQKNLHSLRNTYQLAQAIWLHPLLSE
jgi:hypothetical protein